MSTTRDDLRYALRSLRRYPGFTCVAVASLALGIGVNTAIFSLVDQLFLWSVPARDPGQLVNIEGGRSDTYPFYREYRDRNQVFAGRARLQPSEACWRPAGGSTGGGSRERFLCERQLLPDARGWRRRRPGSVGLGRREAGRIAGRHPFLRLLAAPFRGQP